MSRLITVTDGTKPIYDIAIEQDFSLLVEKFNELGFKNRKIAIISDSNVAPLYAEAVKTELSKTGNQVFFYSFDAGEKNKNLDTVQDVYEYLVLNHFDRHDCLAALGGGVVGDLTGFAAATYMRGIDFIQIPTSLLAMTDSSVGGKTGVDFRAYKNMVGAFHQPRLVYMNMSVLKSLDDRQFNCGLGEILKHGVIRRPDYFEWLLANVEGIHNQDPETMEHMIEESCNVKRIVVENDQKEHGERAVLNFGHTLGHAIEKLSGFSLFHGECVVLGMIAALKISMERGYISTSEYEKSREVFASFGFPMTVNNMTAEEIVTTTKNDKKMDAGKINFVLVKPFGHAYVDSSVTDEEMMDAVKEVLA